MIALYILIGITMIASGLLTLRQWRKTSSKKVFRFQKAQLFIWLALIIGGFVLITADNLFYGLMFILSAQLLPRFARKTA